MSPKPAPMRPSTLRFFVLRLLPLCYASVLLTSSIGGLATAIDGPYRASAVLAASLLVGSAAVPHSLRVRLAAATLASLAWIGRLTWFVVQDVQDFEWSSTYAILVLSALLMGLVTWVMAADWLVVRGLNG